MNRKDRKQEKAFFVAGVNVSITLRPLQQNQSPEREKRTQHFTLTLNFLHPKENACYTFSKVLWRLLSPFSSLYDILIAGYGSIHSFNVNTRDLLPVFRFRLNIVQRTQRIIHVWSTSAAGRIQILKFVFKGLQKNN